MLQRVRVFSAEPHEIRAASGSSFGQRATTSAGVAERAIVRMFVPADTQRSYANFGNPYFVRVLTRSRASPTYAFPCR